MKRTKFLRNTTLLLFALFSIQTGFSQAKEVIMEGNDDMKFSITEIKAKPGESIKLTLKSISKMSGDAMAHNFVLLDKDTDGSAFISDGMSFKDKEYISPNWADVVLVKTKMLPGGKSETITFKAPSAKGKYEFVCTFPGHFQAGMKGFLIVE